MNWPTNPPQTRHKPAESESNDMSLALKIPAKWLHQDNIRLDGKYYGGEGQKEARLFINSTIARKPLCELTAKGTSGVFIPARFKRMYVDNPEFGYPYITGSGIVQSDPLSNCRYLSKKYTPQAKRLALKPKMIAITCSGLIGNTVYINDVFKGSVGSPDLIRVVADENKVLPGYLYAFLSSKIGKALITQGTYGSVVQHIEAHHLYDLPVPLLAPEVMEEIHNLIEEAARLRTEANTTIKEQIGFLNHKFTVNSPPKISFRTKIRSNHGFRLDSIYHAPVAYACEQLLSRVTSPKLSDLCSAIQTPGRFKRIDAENGEPFYSITDVRSIYPIASKRILSSDANQIKYLRVPLNTILVWRTGVVVGDCFLVNDLLKEKSVTEHLVRVIPDESLISPFYLFTFMSSKIGQEQLKRFAYGSAQNQLSDWQIGEILIGRLSKDSEVALSGKIKVAIQKQVDAIKKESLAISKIEQELA